uniref:C1q domain-containing protein n=1 Tax=Cyprinus carpio TaxID=7962 RepID=A0A8C2EJ16_CYPCA
EIKALTCPLQICTDLLQELGATLEKLQDLLCNCVKFTSDFSVKCVSKKWYHIELKQLAFSASLGSNGFFGPDVTLVYKNVFIYVGDAYQQATGIYIAPVRGVYYFSFFHHSGTKHGTTLALYRNGKHVALTHNNLSNNTPENGNGLTLQLEKGDQVYIILRKSTWIWNSENVTVFSGFLINPM